MEIIKQKEFQGHSAGIYSLAFDGKFIYSASSDGFVTRWNLVPIAIGIGLQDKFAINFQKPVYSLCIFNSNKSLIAGLNNGDLHFFDLLERKELRYFTQHKSAVFSIIENQHKNHIYTADSEGNLGIWDSVTMNLLLFLPFNCGKIRRMSISSEGTFLALACQDGNIRILETDFFNLTETFFAHKEGATTVLFHPTENEILFSGGKDAILRKWDWKSHELLKEIPAHNYVLYDLLTLESKNLMITASRDKSIKFWNLKTLDFISKIDSKQGGHRHSVNCLVKMNDNEICSGSDDKRLIWWGVQ